MAEDRGERATTVTLVPMVFLLSALSYATVAQGAFYADPFHLLVVLVGLAVVASVITTRSAAAGTGRILHDPVVVLTGGLAMVTVVSSAVAGHPADAIGPVALLLTMAAVVAVVKALGPRQRRLLVTGIVVLAVVVAVIGWVALVARWQPDALIGQGLWRAASTLTYENALAAFLTAPTLLCLDRLMTASDHRVLWSEAAFVLLVGVGTSLSRGGVLGLVIGIAVLGILRGGRRLLVVGPPAIGALLALACLAPALPVSSTRQVALAGAGLVLGAAAAGWTFGSTRGRLVGGVLAAAILGVAVTAASTGHVFGAIARARASASSSDRAHEWAAALDVARHHLLLGVGTARVLLQWSVGGQVYTATFAHNEYLQLLTQDGVIGLGLLLVGLVFVFISLSRLRHRATAWSAECGIACLAALLVQSSLDFLWHIPVIPVLMATVLALALTPSDPGPRGRDSASAAIGMPVEPILDPGG
jgi:O-Antigen ligase